MVDSDSKTPTNKFARYSPRSSSNGHVPTPPLHSVTSSTSVPSAPDQALSLLPPTPNEQLLTTPSVGDNRAVQPNKFSRYSPPSALNGQCTSSPALRTVSSSFVVHSSSQSALPPVARVSEQQPSTAIPPTTSPPRLSSVPTPPLPQSTQAPSTLSLEQQKMGTVPDYNAIAPIIPTNTFSRYSQRNSSAGRGFPSADQNNSAHQNSVTHSATENTQKPSDTIQNGQSVSSSGHPVLQPKVLESNPQLLPSHHMQDIRATHESHQVRQSHSATHPLQSQINPMQSQLQLSHPQPQSSHSAQQAKSLPQEQVRLLSPQHRSQSQQSQKKPRKMASRQQSKEKKSKVISEKNHASSKQSKQQRHQHPPRPPGQRRKTGQKKSKSLDPSTFAQSPLTDTLSIPTQTVEQASSIPSQVGVDNIYLKVPSTPSNPTLVNNTLAPSSLGSVNHTTTHAQSSTNNTEPQRSKKLESNTSFPLPVLTPLKSSPYSDNQGQTEKVSSFTSEGSMKMAQQQNQSERENISSSSLPSLSGLRSQIQPPIISHYPPSPHRTPGRTEEIGSGSQPEVDNIKAVTRPPRSPREGYSSTSSPSLVVGQPATKRRRKPESSSSSLGASSRNMLAVNGDGDREATVSKSTSMEPFASKLKQTRRRQISWYDTLRLVWPFLCNHFEGRNSFTFQEICQAIGNNWSEVRSEELPKNNRWRSSLMKCIRTGCVVTKVESGNDSDEEFIMQDSNLGPAQTTSTPKVNKRGDMADADETLPDEGALQRAVPNELLFEATGPVRLSKVDKARRLKFIGPSSENRVEGFKGYRSIRATTGVSEGDWYFEVKVLSSYRDGAVRLGWATRRADIETPVGYDQYGFGIRDLTGEFIHKARRIPYGKAFGKGDVIGCRIVLPPLKESGERAIFVANRRWLEYKFIRFSQGPHPPSTGTSIIDEARVEFFKNGESMGIPSFFRTKGEYVWLDGSSNQVDLPAANSNGNLQNSSSEQLPGSSTKATGSVTTGSTSNSSELTSGAVNERALKRRRISANSATSGETSNTPSVDERKLGILKREMNVDTYYPTISLYEDIRVCANFGPTFAYSLPEGSKPMCEAVSNLVSPGAQNVSPAPENRPSSVNHNTSIADELETD